jgi:hypothetical protein
MYRPLCNIYRDKVKVLYLELCCFLNDQFLTIELVENKEKFIFTHLSDNNGDNSAKQHI